MKKMIKMSYHTNKLMLDVINTLGRAVNPLSLDELIHSVINEGYKSQRIYTDDEILDCLRGLLETGFIQENKDGTYNWRE